MTQGKEWIVSFYVTDPASGKLKRVRVKVNRIKNLRERKRAARAMMAAIDQRLALGWNPLRDRIAPRAGVSLGDAMEAFLNAKERDTVGNSMRSYRSFVKTFREWLDASGLGADAAACSFSREHAEAFMDEAGEELSPKTFNNYVAFYRSMFAWMEHKGYVQANPFAEVRKKDRRLTKKRRRMLTDDELHRLFAFLKDENEGYLAICLMCYCCFIRPKEIVMLRCRDIDLQRQTVHVGYGIAKNHNDSFRTIPDSLLPLLSRIDLSRPDWYLFGSHKGDDFTPGPKMLSSREVARWWNVKVRPRCGFGMDLQFYSLKDTGITNMISSGVPVNLVQRQADHSSIAMTAVYVGKSQHADSILKGVDLPH